ncbi:MFS transporter [Saccharopolyspora indica]|uniref:MFS transporter n=1 Tax=Saccharopolyspora indica TaxID=1229659 RepID=UPI0022EA9460|nr:MFS transporter [Saccharopolyspora indica]MDA3643168.1 MFS transporter [Saccharopolyspora indica]
MVVDEKRRSRAGAREWIGLAVLALPLLVLAMDVSVLYLAAPHLSADLRPSSTQALWIMDAYGFLIAGFLVTMGTLGDRIGRRRLLLIGSAAFAAASVLAAFAPTAEMLIAARALLGITGATLMPSTLALIRTMFTDPAQRSVAIAVWMTTFTAGVAAGPLIGGVLLEAFWWGSVFLLAVPVMVLVLVLGPWLLPEHRPEDAGRLDPVSVLLSLLTIVPLVYGFKEIAHRGPGLLPLLALVAGAVAGVLFVRRQRRMSDPLVDVSLFGNRTFSAALVLLLAGLLVVNGVFYLVPQFLQGVAGLTPLRTGMWLTVVALAAAGSSLLAPVVARWWGPARAIAAGAVLSVVGFVLFTALDGSSVPVVVVATALVTAGLSPMGVLTTDLVVGSAPPERAGAAAALSETSGELGVGLGVAVMGTLVTAVYQAQMSNAPGQAGETLADVVALEGSRPDLLEAAREAFTSGINVVGGIGAVVLTGLAVVAVVLLRPAKA